jgi:hypothetical protein
VQLDSNPPGVTSADRGPVHEAADIQDATPPVSRSRG